MGVYQNPRGKHWWLYLEGAPPRERKQRTDILIGFTKTEQKISKAAAFEVYHTRMLQLGKIAHGLVVEKPTITFAAFAAWYDTHMIAHRSARGAERERDILTILTRTFGPSPIADVTKDAVIEWRTSRKATVSPGTVNRETDVLKQVLAAAVPKYLAASPIVGLDRLRGVGRGTYVLTLEAETRLLAALAPADAALIVCAIDTLMRLSDCVNLRREHDHGTYLDVVDPKITPYQVPVSARLRAALDALPDQGPYFFAHRRQAKQARDHRGSVGDMLEAGCRKAAIPYGRPRPSKRNPTPSIGLTFHGLRHTAASRLVERGVHLRVVQELGGWKSLRQLERYAHPTEAAKRAAVESLSQPVLPPRPYLVPKAAPRRRGIA